MTLHRIYQYVLLGRAAGQEGATGRRLVRRGAMASAQKRASTAVSAADRQSHKYPQAIPALSACNSAVCPSGSQAASSNAI